jgi:hypothetical protein
MFLTLGFLAAFDSDVIPKKVKPIDSFSEGWNMGVDYRNLHYSFEYSNVVKDTRCPRDAWIASRAKSGA